MKLIYGIVTFHPFRYFGYYINDKQMSKKHEGKAEKLFKKLGKKIDGMIGDLSDMKEDAGSEFNKRMKEVKKNKETLENELKDFGSKNKHKWEEIEESLEKAAEELRKAFSIAFSKQKQKEKSKKSASKKAKNKSTSASKKKSTPQKASAKKTVAKKPAAKPNKKVARKPAAKKKK